MWVGANAPGMVGGRRAHPPKIETVFHWKLNTKERRKAICSALGAVISKEAAIKRGHFVPENYPFIISDDFESINKTKQLLLALNKLGFEKELERAFETRARSGKGKLRGRRKITKKSLLLVVSDVKSISKAAGNIPGIDIAYVNKLNTEALAPGGVPGRATLFSAKAIESIKKGLFTNKKVVQ
jgi:large subunit ribosomal protein L4e